MKKIATLFVILYISLPLLVYGDTSTPALIVSPGQRVNYVTTDSPAGTFLVISTGKGPTQYPIGPKIETSSEAARKLELDIMAVNSGTGAGFSVEINAITLDGIASAADMVRHSFPRAAALYIKSLERKIINSDDPTKN